MKSPTALVTAALVAAIILTVSLLIAAGTRGEEAPPVSQFRSSYHFAAPRLRTSESKDTSKLIDLVWLWFGSPHDERAGHDDAGF